MGQKTSGLGWAESACWMFAKDIPCYLSLSDAKLPNDGLA